MSESDKENIDDDQKTIADIEKYGLSVIAIEATDYLPSFAYSIGLWSKFGHPELISFGLSVKTLHATINLAADIVKSGHALQTKKVYTEFFESGKSEFIEVDKRNMRDYFGYAIDFNKSVDFPALQLVWTDRNNKFPWDDGFEEEFTYKQPLLDRNADFKFGEPKNLVAFTTRQWLELRKPILRVVHEHNGDWQFLTGDQTSDDIRIVALQQLVLRDNTLNDIFDLDYGEEASRGSIGERWTRSRLRNEDE